MQEVWGCGETGCLAADLQQTLGKEQAIAITTVLTTLDRLLNKGIVRRDKEGKAFRYFAAVTEAELEARIVSGVLDSLIARFPTGGGDLLLAGWGRKRRPVGHWPGAWKNSNAAKRRRDALMVNPALLLVSAVFFLAMSAVFYVLSWMAVTFLLRQDAGAARRWHRSALFAALTLPPLGAGVLTTGGVFLRHSHAPDHLHHSVYCSDIARLLAVPEGKIPVAVGLLLQGAAWLLLGWGIASGLRLLWATRSLERELRPFLKPPTLKLAAALDYVGADSDLGGLEFFEADIPPARSCLLGLRRVRCVLSAELVATSKDEELSAIILHERSHYHAGDVWRTILTGLLNCVFFYMRPLRLLSRRWREETELACDAATTTRTGDPLALASAILRVQGAKAQANPLPSVILGFAEDAACSPHKRIERLLAYAEQTATPPAETRGARLWQWALTGVLALMGLLLLLTPQALCTAHCSLEAIARSLR